MFHSRLAFAVSSSCALVPRPARVVGCCGCGLLQKAAEDLATDYLHYELFDNDPAADKIIRRAGYPERTRAQFVADLVVKELGAQVGRVLEVGCHRGAFLAALKARAPQLELHGFDLNPDYARWIEPICGPGRYHHRNLAEVPGPFAACVLIHTLEHVPAPVEILRTLHGLLAPNGCLVIVVPDIRANPADCYTADHTCHFDATTLRSTLARAGFDAQVETEVIGNELVALGRPLASERFEPTGAPTFPDLSLLERFERGLPRLPERAGYVFGTALIGALVGRYLGDRCLGYADEAPFRQGKTFHGKPVRHPQDLCGETVFLGVAENLARTLTPKLQHWGLEVADPWVLGRVPA